MIIGNTFINSPDMYRHPLYGKISGTYVQILGAGTLLRDQPLDLWAIPALLLAAIVILVQALGQRRSMGLLWLPVIVLPPVAFVLDEFTINFDMVSAFLALLFAAYCYIVLHWSYSTGERAGWVQKLSHKGWLCKTWEGEMAMVSMPGTTPEK